MGDLRTESKRENQLRLLVETPKQHVPRVGVAANRVFTSRCLDRGYSQAQLLPSRTIEHDDEERPPLRMVPNRCFWMIYSQDRPRLFRPPRPPPRCCQS